MTYIAEIAGKDSVAAVHRFMRDNPGCRIIPTIVYTGTEYGEKSSYFQSIKYLSQYAQVQGVQFEKPIQLHNEKLWNLLCIRFQHQIHNKYNFYTPCIMCHLFAHMLRFPVLLQNNGVGIITGERISHNKTIKINQHAETLNAFKEIFKNHNVELIQPVYNISITENIEREIADYNSLEHINDVKCILSGNLNGFPLCEEKNIVAFRNFLNEYIIIIGDYILEQFAKNSTVLYDELQNLIEGIFNE